MEVTNEMPFDDGPPAKEAAPHLRGMQNEEQPADIVGARRGWNQD
jgi:hypothetical protein